MKRLTFTTKKKSDKSLEIQEAPARLNGSQADISKAHMNRPEVFQIDECHLFCDSPRRKLQQAKPPERDEG